MTCDERLEALLNRAGQTISDLPERATISEMKRALRMTNLELIGSYLRMVNIIDRMETALENVCGERDYLHHTVCDLCFGFREEKADFCETCMVGDGVPENWRADDDHSDHI